MDRIFSSDGVELAGHLARPKSGPGTKLPGLVICHGFPPLRGGGRLSAKSFPELADRIATELGWFVLVFTFRGCGDSAGDFSLGGWLDDLRAAARFLRHVEGVRDVWVAGFGTGRRAGLVCRGGRSRHQGGRGHWAHPPTSTIGRTILVGCCSTRARSTSSTRRTSRRRSIVGRVTCGRSVPCRAPRSLRPARFLLMHGSDDDAVPVFDARVLADAHSEADLRIIDGGSHQLRHDPRAIAILLGWLDLQRSQSTSRS